METVIKRSSVLYFIWFFIVCQSSSLGVSRIQTFLLCLVKHEVEQKRSKSVNLLNLMNSLNDAFSQNIFFKKR